MNAEFGPFFRQCDHGVVYGGGRIDGGPHQTDHDHFAFGGFSIADTAHDAVHGDVLGKPIHKDFENPEGLDQVFRHFEFPPARANSDHDTFAQCRLPDFWTLASTFPCSPFGCIGQSS